MKLISVLFFTTTTIVSYSQTVGTHLQPNAKVTAFPFISFSPDAVSSGMGEIGAAINPNANAFHWNTANLGYTDQSGEVSLSYSPWLKQLADNIHLIYLSGYAKLNENSKHIFGGSIRYLTDGNNVNSSTGSLETSTNFEILGGYAYRISENSAIGINGKFIYANALIVSNPDSLEIAPSQAGGLDISYRYQSQPYLIGELTTFWSWGTSISNLGNKTTYSTLNNRDFLPTNLRVGGSFEMIKGENHAFLVGADLNKLLVPDSDWNGLGALPGMVKSFTDNEDGLRGELEEITIGVGLTYSYKDFLNFRTGYFYENPNQGARRFINFGAGVQLKSIEINASYLASLTQNNPQANAIRLGVSYTF